MLEIEMFPHNFAYGLAPSSSPVFSGLTAPVFFHNWINFKDQRKDTFKTTGIPSRRVISRDELLVHLFILCQEVMMFPFVFTTLKPSFALYGVAERWLLLDIG